LPYEKITNSLSRSMPLVSSAILRSVADGMTHSRRTNWPPYGAPGAASLARIYRK
jgi:hypothetical protein